MEWQQLHYFRTLANMQHMTRAAEQLAISQPALSRSIAKLEEELGVPLFDRYGRGIFLNHFGESFLKRVTAMQQEYDKALVELQELNNPAYGEISLGFLHTLGTNIVPDIIQDFRTTHPDVRFHLSQNYSHNQLKLLQSGELDICLLAAIETEPPVMWQELWRDELFVVVPRKHRFAKRKSVTLEELEGESFIHLKKGYPLRKTVDKFFKQNHLQLQPAFEADEVATITGFIAAGLGISLLPNDENYNPERIVKIPVKGTVCERIIGLAWMDHQTVLPAVAAFRTHVISLFHK